MSSDVLLQTMRNLRHPREFIQLRLDTFHDLLCITVQFHSESTVLDRCLA